MADAGGEALSADAYHEILLRSGPADCLNWRRVCWAWHRAISSRSFVVAHRLRHPPRPLPLVVFNSDRTPLLGDLFDPKATHLDVDDSLIAPPDSLVQFQHRDDVPDLSDPKARNLNSDNSLITASGNLVRLQHHDRALLLGSIPSSVVRADGADARAALLLWSLSSADIHAEGGVPLVPFGLARIRPPLGCSETRESPFDAVLQNLSHETGPRAALRVAAVDVRARISATLIKFSGDDAAFSIHGCLDDTILVSYHGNLFAYNACSGKYLDLPPIHLHAVVIGFYSHPSGDGDYRVLYCGQEKPHVYGYYSMACQTHTVLSVSRAAASQGVSALLDSGMAGCQLPPVLLNGSLHWLQTGLGRDILVFEAATSSFRFMKTPNITFPAYQMVNLNGALSVTEVDTDDPVMTVWRLVDYNLEVWVEECHILVPLEAVVEFMDDMDMSENPFVYIVTHDGEVLVECPADLLHFGTEGLLLGRYRHGTFPLHFFTSHILA